MNLNADQAKTLEALSAAKVNVVNTLANISGLIQKRRGSSSPSNRTMQTLTYKELEDELSQSAGQVSADSGFGAYSSDDLDAMFGSFASPSSHGRKAGYKTYSEIDATACLGDPYPKTPRRYRQPTFQPVTPKLIDFDDLDWQQWAQPRGVTPVQQPQTPVRARSTPRIEHFQSPAATVCRPSTAPRAVCSVSPKTQVSYNSMAPRTPSSTRRVLQMSDPIEISDDDEDDLACAAPNASIDVPTATGLMDDFNAMVKMQIEKIKKQIDQQNALSQQKQRRKEERRLEQEALDFSYSFNNCR